MKNSVLVYCACMDTTLWIIAPSHELLLFSAVQCTIKCSSSSIVFVIWQIVSSLQWFRGIVCHHWHWVEHVGQHCRDWFFFSNFSRPHTELSPWSCVIVYPVTICNGHWMWGYQTRINSSIILGHDGMVRGDKCQENSLLVPCCEWHKVVWTLKDQIIMIMHAGSIVDNQVLRWWGAKVTGQKCKMPSIGVIHMVFLRVSFSLPIKSLLLHRHR